MKRTSKLRIKRTVSYADRLRAYKVFVDNKEVAKIKAGEMIEIAVPEGSRSVVAKIDWCRSPILQCDFQAGKVTELECGSNLKGLRVFLNMVYVFFMPTKYLTLQKV